MTEELFGHGLTPEWLDPEMWEDFVAHRKEIKKPLTPTATRRMLNKLQRLNAQGVDVNELLEKSIINRWQDVFYERPTNGSATGYIDELFAKGYRLDLPDQEGGPERKH